MLMMLTILYPIEMFISMGCSDPNNCVDVNEKSVQQADDPGISYGIPSSRPP